MKLINNIYIIYNLNYDAIQDWCEEFAHWNFVQDELANIGIQCDAIDNHVKLAILQLKVELDKLDYGEPESVDKFEKRMKKKKEKDELFIKINQLHCDLKPNQCLKITYVDCDVPKELWEDFKREAVIYPSQKLRLSHLNGDIFLCVEDGEFELFLDYMLDIEVIGAN